MIIGSCRLELYFPGSNSLKDKRHILKSVIQRTKAAFNVAIAEVDRHDSWRLAALGIVTVSNEEAFSRQVIQGALELIEKNPELETLAVQIEML
jgi:uncharacterized protein YlxP (DUF503 family)